MGFYTSNVQLSIPNKSIFHDLIERNGYPDSESFTPFKGMNHLVEEQMVGKYGIFGVDLIKLRIRSDVDLTKFSNSSDVTENIDEKLNIPGNMITLEDVPYDMMYRAVRGLIIRIKTYTTDASYDLELSRKIQPDMFDKDTGEAYNLSSDYVEEDSISDPSIVLVKKKLPYLLKKLHEGSIIYGVSMLSMLISIDSIIRYRNIKEEPLKPRDLTNNLDKFPIYTCNHNGIITGKFYGDPNTREDFRKVKDIMFGVYPNNVYYKAGMELIDSCNLLGYKLCEEDALEYDNTYINRLVNDYILSNQEIIDDMGFDKSIIKMFEDCSIFDEPKISSVNRSYSKNSYSSMIDSKVSAIPWIGGEEISESLIEWFFNIYKSLVTNSMFDLCEQNFYDCSFNNYVLCGINGKPILFNIDMFGHILDSSPNSDYAFCVLSDKGDLIKIDDIPNKIKMISIETIRNYCIDGNYNNVVVRNLIV